MKSQNLPLLKEVSDHFSALLFLNSIGSDTLGQSKVQPYEACDSGNERSGHDAELGMVEKIGLRRIGSIKSECGYEKRHCETDAAKHGDRRHHVPVGMCRHGRETQLHGKPGERQDAKELTADQREHNRKRYTFEHACRIHVEQEDTCIGESEKRHDEEIDNRMQ